MRRSMAMVVLVLLALTPGACGGNGDGDADGAGPEAGPPMAPSDAIPAAVDPAGLTKEQLEAKIAEIERLLDIRKQDMEEIAAGGEPPAIDPETARRIMRVSDDMRALASQRRTYEDALDAMDR